MGVGFVEEVGDVGDYFYFGGVEVGEGEGECGGGGVEWGGYEGDWDGVEDFWGGGGEV